MKSTRELNREEIRRLDEENARLRAALEKYADEGNWGPSYYTTNYGCTEVNNGWKFDDYDIVDIENHPWTIAQEALNAGN